MPDTRLPQDIPMPAPSARALRRTGLMLALDTALLVAFVLIVSPRFTGLALHEWLGIGLILPLGVHLLLATSWISGVPRRLLRAFKPRAAVNYFLNSFLFMLFVIEIVSGIGISQAALPALGLPHYDARSWRSLHDKCVNWTIVTAAFHLAMNWDWVVAALRRGLAARRGGATGVCGSETSGAACWPFAPRLGWVVRWLSIFALAAGVVVVSIVVSLGLPAAVVAGDHKAPHRWDAGHNDDGRSAPRPWSGARQVGGEMVFVASVAFAARRLLRIRL